MDMKLTTAEEWMNYFPDTWVVLKLQNEDEETLYKVLAGWSGGYIDCGSWRINSGVTRAVEKDNAWRMYGSSGSCYVCHKGAYRLSMSTSGVYNELKERFGDRVEMLPADTNWMEIEW